MTHQRRRGTPIKVWRAEARTDERGNPVRLADPTEVPQSITAAISPLPSSDAARRATLRVDADTGIDVYSLLEFDGKQWDVTEPPAYHHGTRQVRHWTIQVRARP